MKPPVIHDKQLDPHLGGDLGKPRLRGFIDIEVRRFPRVEQDLVRGAAVRQNGFPDEVVQTMAGCSIPCSVYPAILPGVANDCPAPASNGNPVIQAHADAVEAKSFTSAAIFQLPLHARTPNQTSPCVSSALPVDGKPGL